MKTVQVPQVWTGDQTNPSLAELLGKPQTDSPTSCTAAAAIAAAAAAVAALKVPLAKQCQLSYDFRENPSSA